MPPMIDRRRLLMSLGAVSSGASALGADGVFVERAEWARAFADHGAVGSIVVLDERSGSAGAWAYDQQRARRRTSPASTFKIPHSLFALDAGVLADEFQRIAWDGVKRPIDAWNADQDLRSAMRNSVVWVYERFAAQIGMRREAAYLRTLGYGNALTGGAAPFWVEGDLAISCVEQLGFLQRLYRNQLPFEVEHQRLVKDVMVTEAGRSWILRGKTGWNGSIGRWVGWVEWPTGPVFFAIAIDTPARQADLPKREAIARAVLVSLGALPEAR